MEEKNISLWNPARWRRMHFFGPTQADAFFGLMQMHCLMNRLHKPSKECPGRQWDTNGQRKHLLTLHLSLQISQPINQWITFSSSNQTIIGTQTTQFSDAHFFLPFYQNIDPGVSGNSRFPWFPGIQASNFPSLPFLWHCVISLPVPGKRKFRPGIRTGNTIIFCSFADGWSRHEYK